MIVVDTNILASLYIASPFTARTERLLESDGEWRSPSLWRGEFRNLLVGYARRGPLTWDETRSIFRRAEALVEDLVVDHEEVMRLARNSDCSAYDCEFVAAAIQVDTELYTMDRKILKAFPVRARALASS